MIKITNGAVIRNGTIENTNLYIEDGKIKKITAENLSADSVIDASGRYVSPGFIDTHVHGGGNADFMDGGTEPMRVAAKTHLSRGTTSISPTTLACPYQDLKKALIDYKELSVESGKNGMPNLIGMHFEGPYFALSRRVLSLLSAYILQRRVNTESFLLLQKVQFQNGASLPSFPVRLNFVKKSQKPVLSLL